MNRSSYTNTVEIKAARRALNLSQLDMAVKLGYKSPATYKYIEDGVTVATIPVAVHISNILGGPLGKFFNLELQETQNV